MNEFMQLVELGYEAVADFSRWPQFLSSYNRAIKAERCGLYVRVQDEQSLRMFESSPADDYWAAQLSKHYSRISPLTQIVQPKPAGWAGLLRFPKSYWHTEFYNDYMAPQDLEHAVAGIMAKSGDAHRVTLMGFRGRRSKPFSVEAGSLQRRVMQQMRWAFMLRQRLLEVPATRPDLWAAWELCPQAAIMLDARRTIAYLNPAAERMLGGACGLARRGNRLVARRVDDDVVLQRLVDDALQRGQHGAQAGGTLTLRTPEGRPAVDVHVHSINVGLENVSVGASRIAVIVFLVSPPVPAPLSGADLRSRFDLTPAEARLALALASGERLKAVADSFGITHGTARSQLLAIFGKTGVRRQTALVRLLLHASQAP